MKNVLIPKTLTWKKSSESSSSSYANKWLNDYVVSSAERIKVLNPSESITEKSKVLIDIEPETSRSKVLEEVRT